MIRTADRYGHYSFQDALDLVMQAFFDSQDNLDPTDRLYKVGPWRVFVFFSSQNVAAWKSPTNAKYTVPTGKTLAVIAQGAGNVMSDSTNRQARLHNVTDNTDVVAPASFVNAVNVAVMSIGGSWQGDSSTPSTLGTVSGGKALELQLWNADTTKRAMGAWVICREY